MNYVYNRLKALNAQVSCYAQSTDKTLLLPPNVLVPMWLECTYARLFS